MNYPPFKIGKNFRIAPPGSPATEADHIDLIMQRGAFGSGEHETTESCLEAMEKLPDITGARILDLGSGTGILAIAALKLGAKHAVCIDIDQDAVATAKSNCRFNGLEHQVTHITGTLDHVDEEGFDLVLANIYGDILLAVAGQLTAATRAGGLLLLSGILWEYNFEVRQSYAQRGCQVVKNRMLSEFSTVLLQKES